MNDDAELSQWRQAFESDTGEANCPGNPAWVATPDGGDDA
jgi:hypothetical protein